MILWLLYPLHGRLPLFNVFRYITFRAANAALMALLLSIFLGPALIRWLRVRQIGQSIREEGPKGHQVKAGTPTMGGVLINLAIVVPTLVFADLSNRYVWVALVATLLAMLIGIGDDWRKVSRKNNRGLSGRQKLPLQTAIGLGVVAIGATLVASATFAILAYIAGNAKAAGYLLVPSVPGTGELAVFCAAIVGASLGFLWFNAHPAEVFMGDTGSLALGAALGTVAVLIKQEILLVLVGGLFVVEAASVILQVGSFKLRGKRIFRMAPLHHHFELAGWPESKVIIRFWIVAILFALFALSTLKLR